MEACDVSVAIPHHIGEWTVDDYFALLPESHAKIELYDGNLVVSPGASYGHQVVEAELLAQLRGQLAPTHRCLSEIDVVLGPASVRRPDVCAVRLPRPAGAGAHATAAEVDLVIEIVSPGSRKTDRLLKPVDYAEAGIPGFWRVELDPGMCLTAYVLDGGAYVEIGTWGATEVARVNDPLPLTVIIDALA